MDSEIASISAAVGSVKFANRAFFSKIHSKTLVLIDDPSFDGNNILRNGLTKK